MTNGNESLHQFGEGVWIDTEPVVHLRPRLTATMTVLRLGDGGLLLHSPVRMTPTRREAVTALGPIAHLYAPNLYHHRWIGEWAAAFPSAQLHAPAGLAKKRPDLRLDRTHPAEPLPPALADVLTEYAIPGFLLA